MASPVVVQSESKQRCIMEELQGWEGKNVTVCCGPQKIEVHKRMDDLGHKLWSWSTEAKGTYRVHKDVAACIDQDE